MPMQTPIRVDGQRLWESLMRLAEIGATPKGGCRRLALSNEDRMARELFVAWAEEANCEVSVDRMGNIFARRPGSHPSLAPVATGSHLDTQPNGGRFDGPLGVMCGLEVVRTLADRGIETRRPIEVVAWTNEEGSRFAPPMVGSGVFAGVFDLAYGLGRTDADGLTIGEELRRIGFDGAQDIGSHAFGSFFEVHIEQGPILEAHGKRIGVVSGAQAQRWYEVTVRGQDAHAGTTPMDRRRDALVGASRIVTELQSIGAATTDGRATVGVMRVEPNSRNTIPGEVFFSIDLRHPSDAALSDMAADMREFAAGVAKDAGLGLDIHEIYYAPPLPFDPGAKRAVTSAAQSLGLESMEIVSGAGHDACHIARVAPTAMVFIPCAGGISHNETESATPEDVTAGCDVLINAIVEAANAPTAQA